MWVLEELGEIGILTGKASKVSAIPSHLKTSSVEKKQAIVVFFCVILAHNAVVTCAVFAPDPDLIIKEMDGASNYSPLGYVLASADFTGSIKIFISRVKQKCSSLPASAIA